MLAARDQFPVLLLRAAYQALARAYLVLGRQQQAAEGELRVRDEIGRADAVIGGLVMFEAEVRDLVGAGVDSPQLDAAAQRAGMTTMMQDAVAKARAGVTSAAEALRVTTAR